MMRALAQRAALSCVPIALGASLAGATERLIVVRGAHCPGGLRPTSAEGAAGSAASDCVVMDPTVQRRLGSGQAATVPADLCRQRAPEIESLGAVLCTIQWAEPTRPPAPERAAPGLGPPEPRRGREHTTARYVVRLLGILFRLTVASVGLTLMIKRRAKLLERFGPVRYYTVLTLLSGSTAALVALVASDRGEILTVLRGLV